MKIKHDQIETMTRTTSNQLDIRLHSGDHIKLARKVSERWTVTVDIIVNGVCVQGNCDASKDDIALWLDMLDYEFQLREKGYMSRKSEAVKVYNKFMPTKADA